jgi:hypothetical protein
MRRTLVKRGIHTTRTGHHAGDHVMHTHPTPAAIYLGCDALGFSCCSDGGDHIDCAALASRSRRVRGYSCTMNQAHAPETQSRTSETHHGPPIMCTHRLSRDTLKEGLCLPMFDSEAYGMPLRFLSVTRFCAGVIWLLLNNRGTQKNAVFKVFKGVEDPLTCTPASPQAIPQLHSLLQLAHPPGSDIVPSTSPTVGHFTLSGAVVIADSDALPKI